ILLTLPMKEVRWTLKARKNGSSYDNDFPSRAAAESALRGMEEQGYSGSIVAQTNGDNFHSSHFDEPNILAHVRVNDRTTADGKKTLFIEEVQSDWHQLGRDKGYRQEGVISDYKLKRDPLGQNEWIATIAGRQSIWQGENEAAVRNQIEDGLRRNPAVNGVPNAPFKKTWHELALKKVLRKAVEGGYDSISWTTGEQQAERYDLSKQVQSIIYKKNTDGTFKVSAIRGGEGIPLGDGVSAEKLVDVVGKDVARKINSGEGNKTEVQNDTVEWTSLSGVDLKVGGEGMRGFYDGIIPAFLNKYTKKWGGKVSVADITAPENRYQITERDGLYVVKRGNFTIDNFKSIPEAEAWISDHTPTEELGVHTLEITPSMRESVAQGQPMFQADRPTSGTTEGQSEALTAFNKIISANKMTDAVFAELVDSIKVDRAAFRKGYGTEYSADKFAIRGATYPIRNHPTIRALVRFAKGAHQGTGYHEAMHVIFNNLLTAQERQVLMGKFGTEEQAAKRLPGTRRNGRAWRSPADQGDLRQDS
ncbi:MAG: hypothetical protein IPH01_11190, partial [Elusimicrobia bacterium]|nr:hypothetical protein [Elusimicrobiota bacterium]